MSEKNSVTYTQTKKLKIQMKDTEGLKVEQEWKKQAKKKININNQMFFKNV